MNAIEKEICDDILRDGKVIKEEEFGCEGINVEQYIVELDGQEYLLTKNNGEWVYMFHKVKIGGRK